MFSVRDLHHHRLRNDFRNFIGGYPALTLLLLRRRGLNTGGIKRILDSTPWLDKKIARANALHEQYLELAD